MSAHTTVRAAILSLLLALLAREARADKPGCKDHPLLPTRMPNYEISDCKTTEFDGFEFHTLKPPKHHEEGKSTGLTYNLIKGKEEASGLAVIRNYEAAITKLGGSVVATDQKYWMNAKVTVDGKEFWIEVEKGNSRIWLRIIEKVPMVQHIVADAAAFSTGLQAAGHVAVEGIYFDTGKAEVKPESAAALEQVAKLLAAEPSLKLWVVGHTDSVGKIDDNIKLAQARADAVVKALVTTQKIAAGRLKGYGAGPIAPVASNDTEDGRARNRRVELVKQP